jgi:1,2-phenylacetyl-CoA epoxidase catalytic subunit
MPVGRRYAPREIDAADLSLGRVEPHYRRVLVRLLAAHATAQRLAALGYARAIETVDDPALKRALGESRARQSEHAARVYGLLEELGVNEKSADRLMISPLKAPSFEAPRHFAERARGELDLAMATIAVDATGRLMIGVNYCESSYAPHSRAAELMLDEETEDDLSSWRMLGSVVERFGAPAVTAALRQWLPRAVNFFGPPGSGFTYDCLCYGLKARDNQELADLYLTILQRRAAQLGLELPAITSGYPHAAA